MYKNLNGLHHQHPARLYSCVSLGWLNGVTQYWFRNLCGFAYHSSYAWGYASGNFLKISKFFEI
ncbi:hypothetical protein T03_9961 [Trichinella britovi]|uniref:Uncharacterized protein n=1 Tax=Trichinella britovi TaxID=45882 RepID=A0A0V1DIL6_TRIBR|nr:hypothetical protein T03_9961 [Trichinella britovi]